MRTEFYCIVNRAKYHIFMNSSVEASLSTIRVWLYLIDHVRLSLTREHVCRSHELHDEGAHSIRASWTRVGVFVVDYGQPLCTEDHQGEQTPLSSLSLSSSLLHAFVSPSCHGLILCRDHRMILSQPRD